MNKLLSNTPAIAVLCCVCLLLATLTAKACGPDCYTSVHFNTAQPDFGAPPRTLTITSWQEEDARPLGCPPSNDQDSTAHWEQQRRWRAIGTEALQSASRLETEGKFAEAMPHYRNALKHGAGVRAAIMDREELFDELTPTTDRALLHDYLTARRDYEQARPGHGEAQMQKLAADPHAGILRAHALYVLGAIQADANHPAQAATIFEQLVTRYPDSRRREAALIMIPRMLLQDPGQDEHENFHHWIGKALPAGTALARSRQALQTLLREYPDTRFRQSAQAWLARGDYLAGHRVAALESYLHQYATFTGQEDRESAAASVNFVSAELTAKEAQQIAADLRQHAELLGDYLEYRLDHESEAEQDRARLADLATELAGNQQLHLQAQSAARLAEAQYLRGRYREAITWSDRALTSLPGSGKDLALYVRGAANRKARQKAAAEADFQQLLRKYPDSYLCGAARENLALLYERSDRPGMALDQYFLLGYAEDIAYLLDARMTTDQVADYLSTHPNHPKHDLLVYTLGIRQLRDNQLMAAQATLARLPEPTILALTTPKDKAEWQGHDQLRDPRKTAGELTQLEQAVALAHEPNAQAEALYAKASYLYTNRDLLFYNYPLWQGGRSVAFSLLWNSNATALTDLTAVRQHHYAHECLYRTRTLCLEIARRYPQSPTAAKALYRAACASNMLANFDDWWRKEAARLRLADDATRLMKRVYQEYPHDPLAGSARKFAQVYAEEHAETVRNTLFAVAQ